MAAAICVSAAIVTLPVALDRITTASLRNHLQTLADEVAVAALFAGDLPDAEALEMALAANGVSDDRLVSSLRRYETGGGRASEVVISRPVRSSMPFLTAQAGTTLEVTGRAITWK